MSEGRVGFVLCSSVAKPIPSTRIAVLNMLPFLQSAGLQSCILFEPPEATESPSLAGVAERAIDENCKVVVLQKVSGPSALALARQLATVGVRTVFAVCDRVDVPMATVTDATIVISDFLKSLYPMELQSRIHVVHDGIENPDVCKRDWGTHDSPLKALLVTSHGLDYLPIIDEPPSWLNVRIVGRYQSGLKRLREIRWKWGEKTAADRMHYLKFLMNRRITCVSWGFEKVYQEMISADIGIIPISTPTTKSTSGLPPDWMRKSENRLTLIMSAGLPVVATPIPSYESVIEHGRNGFLARTTYDWDICLNALRDPALRREMGMAARVSVEKTYSMQDQASKLICVLCELNDRSVKNAANATSLI